MDFGIGDFVKVIEEYFGVRWAKFTAAMVFLVLLSFVVKLVVMPIGELLVAGFSHPSRQDVQKWLFMLAIYIAILGVSSLVARILGEIVVRAIAKPLLTESEAHVAESKAIFARNKALLEEWDRRNDWVDGEPPAPE